jgi:hypothetical protein
MSSLKRKTSPSPKPDKKSQIVVTTGSGSTIKMGDLGKKAPTPTPKTRIGKVKEWTSAEYDAILRKIVSQNR